MNPVELVRFSDSVWGVRANFRSTTLGTEGSVEAAPVKLPLGDLKGKSLARDEPGLHADRTQVRLRPESSGPKLSAS